MIGNNPTLAARYMPNMNYHFIKELTPVVETRATLMLRAVLLTPKKSQSPTASSVIKQRSDEFGPSEVVEVMYDE